MARARAVAAVVALTLVVASLAVLAGVGIGAALAGPACASRACVGRVQARELEHHYQLVWRAAPAATRAHLRRIAQCESRGDARAVSPSGKFRGLLQFSVSTWMAMGGRGDPAAASRWEQWARGVRLYETPARAGGGPGSWPVCQFAS